MINRNLLRILVGLFALYATIHPVYSCDICGCGIQNNGTTMGLLQTVNYPFWSISHRNTQFSTQLQERKVSDQLNTINLMFSKYVAPKWQVQVGTSVMQITRNNAYTDLSKFSIWGIGDVTANINYKLFDNRNKLFKTTTHLLLAGIGIKIPNGNYQLRDPKKQLLPIQLQPGNGSNSLSFNTVYAVKIKNMGVNLNTKYNYHFTNELNYQQGKSLSFIGGFFYAIENKSWQLIPQILFGIENYNTDKQYNVTVPYSGGSMQLLGLQLEGIYKNMYINAGYFQPVNNNTPSQAAQMNRRFYATFGWLIYPPKTKN